MKPIQLLSLSLFIITTACNHPEKEVEKDAGPVPDSIINHVQTATVLSQDDGNTLKLNGKIQPDDSRQAKLFALVSGKIHIQNVELGDYVKKGQVLAVLNSSEVAGMSNDLSLAESNVQMAKKSLERNKDLYEGKLATEEDYTDAQITYNKSLSELNKAKQVASITGGNKSTYTIIAPISGYIIEKNVTNNSEVRQDNNTDLFAIADLSGVWIMANVYESDMYSIHIGDSVLVNTLANPLKDYTGRVDKIYSVLDPATRTMKVRISMNNPNNELKPEMFATIKVRTTTSSTSLTIPSKAIVMDNSKNYVVTKKGNKLEVHEINLIKRIDDKAYISGLTSGDQVVDSSQLFLYQALNNK